MLTLCPGKTEQHTGQAGFVMVRDLLVLFVVVVCVAVVLSALMVFTHQGARMMRTTEQTINERNTKLEKLQN